MKLLSSAVKAPQKKARVSTVQHSTGRQQFDLNNAPVPPIAGREPLDLEPLMRMPEVLKVIPVSISTLRRMIKRGEFPSPKRISTNAVAFSRREVAEFIRRCLKQYSTTLSDQSRYVVHPVFAVSLEVGGRHGRAQW